MAENKIFTVATAHLDTVWRWELPKTINEFLPDTFEKNLDLIEKYPNYNFNLEGAFRYELIEEYYPQVFETDISKRNSAKHRQIFFCRTVSDSVGLCRQLQDIRD